MSSNTIEHQVPSETSVIPEEAKRFPVIEIFGPVIQGEGSQVGQQTMFIRFGGCDFRCTKCDSLHAVDPQAIQKHAKRMTPMEIAEQLALAKARTGVKWVTFSGGNPCMHQLGYLIDLLHVLEYRINVETQGTLAPDWLSSCDVITVSPKGPGMGEKFPQEIYRRFLSKIRLDQPLCVKIVVFTPADLEFALHVKGITDDAATGSPPGFIAYYLSLGNPYPPVLNEELDLVNPPEFPTVRALYSEKHESNLPAVLLADYRNMSEEILQDTRLKDFRFLPQLHVLVYGNETGR